MEITVVTLVEEQMSSWKVEVGDKVVDGVPCKGWSDGDVVVGHGDEVGGVQNLRTFAISAITNSSDIESGRVNRKNDHKT
ncbi:ribonuclease H-like domain-containing protein [Tanacetum coccineum]